MEADLEKPTVAADMEKPRGHADGVAVVGLGLGEDNAHASRGRVLCGLEKSWVTAKASGESGGCGLGLEKSWVTAKASGESGGGGLGLEKEGTR